MGRYSLVSVWWVAATPEDVWNVLADYRKWPAWWQGVRAVELLAEGDSRAVGAVLRQRWRSLLPLTLVFDLTLDTVESARRLEGHAAGDLVGECRWVLTPEEGGTHLTFSMAVRPGRWWMNLPVPFAGAVFRANFDAVMGWGRTGLGRALGVDVQDRTERARRKAGGPPPA